MSISPMQLARVSNLLRTSTATQSLARTQRMLLEVQNQLATGKRLAAPSDDVVDAAVIQKLRKTLEQYEVYAGNMRQAGRRFGEVDAGLDEMTKLVDEALRIASQNAGTVPAGQRANAVTVIDSLYRQALAVANRQSEGLYLFGGDRSTAAPFVESSGGVRFAGSTTLLANRFSDGDPLAFQIDGSAVFGGLATRSLGSADLTPTIDAGTRLGDLRGAGGLGVRLGSIRLGNGSTSAVVDLSAAHTVQDVINAINGAGVGGITAAIGAGAAGLAITGAPGDDITVQEVGGGATAADLGILRPTGLGAGVPLTGQPLQPRVTELSTLASLRGGLGIDTASGLRIGVGSTTVDVDLSTVSTVEGLLDAINRSGAPVLARINAAGDGIDVVSAVQGLPLTVGENGGATAAHLGIRSFTAADLLSDLNGGRGVSNIVGRADLRITSMAGVGFDVDLDGAATVQDVIDAINAASTSAGANVTAAFAPTGNGLVLIDNAGGSGTLRAESIHASTAAADLGLNQAAVGNAINGADVHPIEVEGVFSGLMALRAALVADDGQGITRAAEMLQGNRAAIVNARGDAGARLQELEQLEQRVEDQTLSTQAMLSTLEDVDFNEAITRFQTLQTTLEANLRTSGAILNLSLLDFIR